MVPIGMICSINTPCQHTHTLSTHPVNTHTPCQHTLSTHPVIMSMEGYGTDKYDLPYQHTLSTHLIPSSHPLNTPSQHTLSTHPINLPYLPTYQYTLTLHFTNPPPPAHTLSWDGSFIYLPRLGDRSSLNI